MEILPLILFILGFYILIKGAQALVRGASSMARLFGLSRWFIGIAIVGIGTSIPELSINLASVFNGQAIGLSTIIGSNTFNILVILGLSSLLAPIKMERAWIRDFWFNFLAIIAASFFILSSGFGDASFSGITRIEGLFLFALFSLWMILLLRRPEEKESGEEEVFTILVSIIMIILGIVGVFIGGRWVIEGAGFIALSFGVSESLVGLTLVAIGTSLPELTVSVIAALKKKPAISVGNIIGSNIFDFLGILGITAIIKPIIVLEDFRFDILATLGAGLILLLALHFYKKHRITRIEGLFFLLAYVVYFTIIFLRG